MTLGQIYKIHSDFYYVDDGNNYFECKIREIIKKQKEKVLVGDYVEFENNIITSILPRKNSIMRPNVANIDQIIIVSALKEPELNLLQLNRYITLAKYHNIKTILCFNKSDLNWDRNLKDKILKIYKPLGFEIVFTSALEKTGIKGIENLLTDKTSVLCGTSGAGKSSLINALNPKLHMRIGEVSDKSQKGTHTTRHCEIVKIGINSRIVDTPGFNNIKFDFIMPNEIDSLFDDIAKYKKGCKYNNCLHINENGCSVLKNIKNIDSSRYESYLSFVTEANDYKQRIKNEGKKTETSKKIINNKQVAKISDKRRKSARNTEKQKIYKEIENE